MSKMSRHPSDTKVYVGELGNNASKQELEDAFGYYGHLRSVWVARNPPGFAFVEFEDPRDAEDAVRALDGRTVCGRRARVELSNGRSGRSRGGGGGGGSGGGGGGGGRRGGDRSGGRAFHPEDKCYECGDRGHYARDCTRSGRRGGGGGGGGGGAKGRRSRSNSRSSSRSRGDRRSRSGSRSVSKNGRSRSPSPPPRRRERSLSRSDRSRSRNGD